MNSTTTSATAATAKKKKAKKNNNIPNPHKKQSEVHDLKSTLYIPETKTSVWVYPSDTTDFSHTFAGIWSVPNFKIDKVAKDDWKRKPVELWTFYDDDPIPLEDQVLKNNPMQGAWGYTANVKLQHKLKFNITRPKTGTTAVKGTELILVPPGAKPPPGLLLQGIWVLPVWKRDMSGLEEGTAGFLTVSAEIQRKETYSVGGAWKMLGHNDTLTRSGRSPPGGAGGDAQGQWEIKVRTPKGIVFSITVLPSHKIAQCQDQIFEKKRVPPSDQRLSFEGTPLLQAHKTVLGSGIRNGDTIDMGPMELFVRHWSGKKFKFSVVDPDELVKSVKRRAEPKVGIPVAQQRLFFQSTPLSDDAAPLSLYKGIQHHSILDLAPMVIFVEPLLVLHKADTIELRVEPTDTIHQIQVKVNNRIINMPVEDQRLVFQGKELTDPNRTLADYNIQHLDTLTMKAADDSPAKKPLSSQQPRLKKPKTQPSAPPADEEMSHQEDDDNDTTEMIIYIVQDWDPKKTKMTLQTTPTDKGLQIKQQIQKLLQIPVPLQILTFQKKLVKNKKSLEESKIKHKSTLHLQQKQPQEPHNEENPEDSNPAEPQPPPPVAPVALPSVAPPKPKPKQAKPPKSTPPTPPAPPPPPPTVTVTSSKPGNVHILHPKTQKKFPIRIDPLIPFDFKEFKDTVAKKINRPPRKFQLVNDDTQQPLDEKTIPHPGTVFHIQEVPDPGQVTIQVPNSNNGGRQFHLLIDPEDTIEDIKQKAAKPAGISPDRIQLVDENGDEPEDHEKPKKGTVYQVRPLEDNEITIQMPSNGRSFHMVIDPDDTGTDIKKKLKQPSGFPVKQMRLLDDNGDDLQDDERPLNGRTYHLAPPEITVEIPGGGNPVTLTLLPEMTVDDLKTILEDTTGIPKGKQRVFFFDDDKDLDDNAPVFKTGLKHGTTIGMEEVPDPKVTVNMPGRSFHLAIDPEDTVKDIKKKLAKRSGYPVKHVRLFDDDGVELDDVAVPRPGRTFHMDPPEIEVELPGGTRTKLGLLPDMTIGDVKDILEEATGVPKAKQRVFFFDNDKDLDDNAQVFKTGLKHGSTIGMEEVPEPEVTVNMPGRSFHLVIDPEDTVKGIKKKLARQSGYPVKHVRLFDDDDVELDDAAVPRPGRTFHMDPPEIEVELPGGTRTKLGLLPDMTIGDVKDILEEATGVPKAKQRVFFFDGDDDLDDNAQVFKTGLKHGSTIGMEEVPEPEVTVNMPGRSFHLVIDPDDTVKDIKKKLARQSGYPVKHVRLFDDDDVELDDAAVPRPGRTFHMDPPEIEVELPGGNRTKLGLLPDMTIGDVKDILEEATGVPKAKQRVFFFDDDEDLDDNAQVFKTGLKQGSTIGMEEVPEPELTIKTSDGRTFTVFYDTDDTPKEVLKKIAKKVGVPPTELKLFCDEEEIDDGFDLSRLSNNEVLTVEPRTIEVVLPDGGRVKLSVLPLMTIEDLKDMVEERTGTPKNRIFFFDNDGMEIDKREPVTKSGLRLGAPLVMRLPESLELEETQDLKTRRRPFFFDAEENDELITKSVHKTTLMGVSANVLPSLDDAKEQEIPFRTRGGRTFVLTITPEDTVKQVKKKLLEKSKLEVGSFMLGDLDFDDVDEDEVFLNSHSSIRQGAVLVAEPPKVEIEVPGVAKKIKMVLLPTTTIADVKRVVEEQIPEYRAKKQRMFFFDNVEELDDETPFKKLALEKGMQLELRDFQIQVEHWKMNKIVLDVQTTEYIDDVKEKIFDAMNIPVEQQNLTFNGKPVRGDVNLKQQDIGPSSVLKLKPMKVDVLVPDGRQLSVAVDINDSILKLKKKIAKIIDSPVEIQCIMAGGKEFENNRTLNECNVRHTDLLTMELFRVDVMDWDGDLFTVKGLKPSDSVEVLKSKINAAKDVPNHMQNLILNGRKLSGDGSLKDQGIRHRAALLLEDPTEVDFTLPEREQLSLSISKTKRFTSQEEDIWPVVPDWSQRIFFFDNDETFDDGLVKLTVLHWTGKSFVVDNIRLGIKLEELKRRIMDLKKIPILKQQISFNGKTLDSDRTLRQQMVKHKSTLVLEGKRETNLDLPESDKIKFGVMPSKIATAYNVVVKHWKGDEYIIQAEPTDYVDDLKETILKNLKIPIDQQRISFEGEEVSETDNLIDQGIASGSLLLLEPMEIGVEIGSGEKLRLSVEADDTIREIKKMIFKMTEIPVSAQCVMFGGVELKDSQTLQECEVEHEDLLHLEDFKLKIMHFSGELFTISGFLPTTTIKELKEEIFRIKHVPKDKQILSFHGKQLEKNKTLEDQGIHHKSVLIMEEAPNVDIASPRRKISLFSSLTENADAQKPSFELSIEAWDGTTFTIESDPNDYVDDLKEKIQKKRKIPIDQQHISFQGVVVREDGSLQSQNIGNGSLVKLEPMRVFVDEPGGSRLTLEVENDFTIRTLKRLIEQQGHARGDGQCLMYAGKELDDGKTLKDYQIRHEETLSLEFFKIVVMDESGVSFDIMKLDPRHTISKVKREIMILKSIPNDDQRLSYQGNDLHDKKTLADEGIRHKAVIVLEVIEKEIETPQTEKFKLSFRALPTMGGVLPAKSRNISQKKSIADLIDEKGDEDESVSSAGSVDSESEDSDIAKPPPSQRKPTMVRLAVVSKGPASSLEQTTKRTGNPSIKSANASRGGGKWWDKSSADVARPSDNSLAETKKSRKINFTKTEKKDEAAVNKTKVGTRTENTDNKKEKRTTVNKSSKSSSRDKAESGTSTSSKSSSTSKSKKVDDGTKNSSLLLSSSTSKQTNEEDGTTGKKATKTKMISKSKDKK